MASNPVITKIQTLVEETGNQKDVAQAMGVSQSYLSDILKGKRDISANVAALLGFEHVDGFRQVKSVRISRMPGPDGASRPILVDVEVGK